MVSSVLRMAGVKYTYLSDVFDAIMVFVILPTFHLPNDHHTKDALKDENHFLALKQIFES